MEKNEENDSLILDFDEYDNDSPGMEEENYQYGSWLIQIILWIYLIYIIFSKNINYIIIIIIYCIYLFINIFMSKWTLLLYNSISLNTLFTKLFYSPLEISFCVNNKNFFDCLNNLDCMDKNKYSFPYYSCKDVSGLIVLKTPLKNKNIKYLHVYIECKIYMFDDISKKDFENQYNNYQKIYIDETIKNSSNNIYTKYCYYLRDYKFKYHFETLIKLDEKSYISYFVNVYLFIFFKIICLGKLYEMFIFRYIYKAEKFIKRENTINIRKVISTRYKLNTPEISKKYAKLTPCVNFNGKFYFFNKEKSIYVLPGVIPILPDEKEMNKKYNGSYFTMDKNFDNLIKKGKEYKTDENKSSDLTVDYLIKVNDNQNQYTNIS